jgi:antitoxin ParD1/3/4
MNVSLTPELENYIQQNVKSKMYQTASEVVREALRLHKKQQENDQAKLAALRSDIHVAAEESKRGEGREFTRAVAEEIIAKGRRRLEARKARP